MNNVASEFLPNDLVGLYFMFLAIGTGLYGTYRILSVLMLGVSKSVSDEHEDVLIVGVVNIGISLTTLAWMLIYAQNF